MKVKIGNKIHDSNQEPIMLVFDDDESRKLVANHLSNMENLDGTRKYIQYPSSVHSKKDIEEFMKL